ncbi:hypothetical protein B0A49_04588 [Cryomyces minteri]|uniref:Hap4 transcription factor heteromerisation domain-containing protein n=1 Tax=Cryomyces minteri TaxID=331657 RepID=A0A4V5NG47_9PEZI|nr:hypothetical protein B0A49_04588 [Cryomyces minteri]
MNNRYRTDHNSSSSPNDYQELSPKSQRDSIQPENAPTLLNLFDYPPDPYALGRNNLPSSSTSQSGLSRPGSAYIAQNTPFRLDAPTGNLAKLPSSNASTAGAPGPASNNWTVPPRPRPGRKPATEDAPTKRKEQNRKAQRLFRERRTQLVSTLEEEKAELVREHEQENQVKTAFYEGQIAQLHLQNTQERLKWRNKISALEDEVALLRRMLARKYQENQSQNPLQNRQDVQTTTTAPSGRPASGGSSQQHQFRAPPIPQMLSPDVAMCVPQHVNAVEHTGDCDDCVTQLTGDTNTDLVRHPSLMATTDVDTNHVAALGSSLGNLMERHSPPALPDEIDFTARFANPKTKSSAMTANPGEAMSSASTPTAVDPCGFCNTSDGNSYCLCNDENQAARKAKFDVPADLTASQPGFGENAIATMGDRPSIAPGAANYPEATAAATGPGNCDDCRTDPNRASWCRSLAAQAPPRFAPSTTNSNHNNDDNNNNSSAALAHSMPPPAAPHESRISCSDIYDFTRLAAWPPSQSISFERQPSFGSGPGSLGSLGSLFDFDGSRRVGSPTVRAGNAPAMEFTHGEAVELLNHFAANPRRSTLEPAVNPGP